MAEPLFALKEVCFSYPEQVPALCGISLTIEEGAKVAIIGANGTGKSTLLMLLDALFFPSRGSVKAFGRELSEENLNAATFSRFFRSRVGFVFQNPEVQLFCPTVKEDIAFGPLQLGVPQDEVQQRLEKLVALFKIAPLLERSPHQLSIGEKKKVAIASVLAVAPDVMLLDEPTAGLDPATTRELLDLILEYHTQGKTIITATQDLHILPELAQKIYLLGAGNTIVASGKTEDILSDQDLLSRHNLLHIHRHEHAASWHTHPHQHLSSHPHV